jgi:hypothetical protein
MALEIYIFPHLLHPPIGTYQHGAAVDAHKFLAVAFPFAPEAQLFQDNMAHIGQQREIEEMFLDKGMVRIQVIGANAVDSYIECFKLRNSITEFRCFDCSAIGIIFRIGKEYITLPKQLFW